MLTIKMLWFWKQVHFLFPLCYFPRRFQTAMNRDVSSGPLAFPFAHHVHSFDCSALLTSLAHSTKLTCSLAHALCCAHSFAHLITPKLQKRCDFDVMWVRLFWTNVHSRRAYRQVSLQSGRQMDRLFLDAWTNENQSNKTSLELQ